MRRSVLVVASAFAFVALAGAARADDVRVIVGFKGHADAATVARHGGQAGSEIASARALAASVPAGKIADLRADADVAYVEEDGVVEAIGKPTTQSPPTGPTQPAQSTPWGITRVGGDPSSTAGAGVDVAVIDTGIDLSHPDLKAHIGTGVSYVARTTANDDNGHGTHVAGTIGAIDNTIGVVGVAPGCTLHPVKVLDKRGSGWLSDVAAGIDWCASHGIEVANMSLGASSGATTLQDSCDAADAAGVLLIAAAGNSGDSDITTDEISYPAYYGSVVSVGATDSSDGLAYFTNSNADVEVSGPGVSVYSTYKGSAYATMSGTSMATPHAVGVAALYWAATSGSTNTSVRDSLTSNAQDAGDAGRDNGYGYGIVHFQ